MTAKTNLDELIDRRLSRRGFVGLAGAAGAALLLAACGGDDDNETATKPAATSAGGGATATTASSGATATTSTGGGATATTSTGGASPTTSTGGASPTAATSGATATSAPQGKQGGTLTMGYNVQQLLQLDPARISVGRVAGELLPNIFSSLVQFDEDLNIVPDLAEGWDVSKDGLTYTFHLRDGLKFHNDDPLTANDFVYTFNRTQDPALSSPHANKLKSITAAEAPDDVTFKVTFSAPFAPFLATTCSRGPGRALTPVPKRAVDEIGNDEFLLKPVGCGPFKLLPETMDSQAGFEMEAWDGWYGGRPLLDKIVVKFIPDPASQVNALAAGDVDMLNETPASGYAQVKDNSDVIVEKVPGTNWIAVQFNLSKPPFDNQDARMAVAKGIDKQKLIDTALFGLAQPSVGAIAPAFAWATQSEADLTENPQAYDLDAAKALAESSGLVDAKPAVLALASDNRVEQTIRNQLLDIGVDLAIDAVEDAVNNDRWEAGDYMMIVNGSVVDADPDDNDYNFFYPDGPWNTGKWNRDECKKQLDLERSITDQAARAKAFQAINDLARKEAAFAFLYHTFDLPGYRSYVKGFRKIPEIRYLEGVWLDK